MKRKPIKMSTDHAKALIDWIEKNKGVNWGSWSEKPNIGIGATYLSYDRNPMQINLDGEVELGGLIFRCISESTSSMRIMGKKNSKSFIGIEGFKEMYHLQLIQEEEPVMNLKGTCAEDMPIAFVRVFKRGKLIADIYPDVDEEIMDLLGNSAEYIDQGEDVDEIVQGLHQEFDRIWKHQADQKTIID
jgi:hypothetical protein